MPQGLKSFHNKIFYICLIIVALATWLNDMRDLRDFYEFLYFIIKVVPVTFVLYVAVNGIVLIIDLINQRARIEDLSIRIPKLVPYEQKRMSILIEKIKRWGAVFASVGFFLFSLHGPIEVLNILALYLLYPAIFSFPFVLNKFIYPVENDANVLSIWFKRSLIEDELNKYFEDVTLNLEGSLPAGEIYTLGLFSNINYVEGNDLITGKRNDIKFFCCDLQIKNEKTKRSRNGEYYTYEDIFSGIAYKFENPSYSNRLLIVTTGFPNIRDVLTDFDKKIGIERKDFIETESEVFNQIFDVYTRDAHNAQKILSPVLIDNISRIYQTVNKKMLFLFNGDSLYLFINSPNRDRFEIEYFSGKTIEEQYFTAATDIKQMADILDYIPKTLKISMERDMKNFKAPSLRRD